MKEKELLGRFDYRLLEQRVRAGKVDKKDYQAFIKSLPDSESNADFIEVYEEEVQEPADLDSLSLTFAPADHN